MERVKRKCVKRLRSGPKKCISPKNQSKRNEESKARFSNSIIEKEKPNAPTCVINKQNEKVNSTKKLIENKNNLAPINNKLVNNGTAFSKVTLLNITDDDVIDITDTIIYSKTHVNFHTVHSYITVPNIEKDDIIDITDDTTICNNEHKYLTVSSKVALQNNENYDIIDITDTTICDNEHECLTPKVTVQNDKIDDIIDITDITINGNEKVSCNDGVQFTSNITHVQNKLDEVFIISDSEEENTPHQKCIEKPSGFKSIKKYLGISADTTNTIKKPYISLLSNCKKLLRDENVQEVSFHNIGAFIVDKQKISNNSHNHNAVTFSQKRIPITDTALYSKRKLRPIIIDGLNIGHAHGRGVFSAKGIVLCVEYFAHRGHKEIIAFIPQHRQGASGTETNIIVNKLLKNGNLCFTPSRKVQNKRMTCYDDRILLNYAHDCNGVVVSNDNYRDLYKENDAFKDIIENRQVMITFVKDKIIVPDDQYNRKSDVRSLLDILYFPASVK